MWIIVTSTHSNMGLSQKFVIGRFQLFIAMYRQEFIQKIGQAWLLICGREKESKHNLDS